MLRTIFWEQIRLAAVHRHEGSFYQAPKAQLPPSMGNKAPVIPELASVDSHTSRFATCTSILVHLQS